VLVVVVLVVELSLAEELAGLIAPVDTLFSEAIAVPVALVVLDDNPGGPPVPLVPPPPPPLLPCRRVSCSLRM
jgi:hypothetical protein